jgi:alkylation response protein AidB-like acyl-CoA dehydrogenase
MDVELSGEQEQLRATVRAFLAERAPVRPYVRDRFGAPWEPDDVWRGLGELGVTGLLAPHDAGGSDETLVTMGVALEELGRAVCPAPVVASAVGAVLLARSLLPSLASGEVLPSLASGEVLPSLASGEVLPSLASGEVLASLASGEVVGAVVVDHAQPWDAAPVGISTSGSDDRALLTGSCAWVADAAAADVLLVPALARGHLTIYLVDGGAPGCTIRPREHVDGTRRFADVDLAAVDGQRLDAGVDVDVDALLAGVVDALTVAYVLDGLGAAEATLALTIDYAKERTQFGAPIGTFQAVQHLCADMLRDVEVTRAMAYYAMWAVDAAEPGERHRAATMAKAVAADALPRVGAHAIQVHGGIGFTWEHDVHLFHKRLLTVQHVFGGADDQLDALADLVLPAR